MKIVAFVPIKLNSERVPQKNIRQFHNGKPLIEYILSTLVSVKELDEIYVYCSSEQIFDYLPQGVKFLKRDPYYDLSSTSFNEVLESFAEKIEADYYVLTHATAPFLSAKSISAAINAVTTQEYDSAFSVMELKEFVWKNGTPLNYSLDAIPRTQDLEDMYTETCGLYVYSRELILKKHRRIGDCPYLLPISKIEACDINTEEDFFIADAISNMLKE